MIKLIRKKSGKVKEIMNLESRLYCVVIASLSGSCFNVTTPVSFLTKRVDMIKVVGPARVFIHIFIGKNRR